MLRKKPNSIYTQLSNKYGLPYQVIEVVCNSPFKFCKEIMADENDAKDIMFAYLFKIKLKKRFKPCQDLQTND